MNAVLTRLLADLCMSFSIWSFMQSYPQLCSFPQELGFLCYLICKTLKAYGYFFMTVSYLSRLDLSITLPRGCHGKGKVIKICAWTACAPFY